MGRDRELKVKIVGDSRGGEKAFKNIDNASERSGGILGRVSGFMQGALDKVGLGGSKASKALGGMGDVMGGGLAAGATAGAAAIGAIGATVAKGINDFVGLAAEVRNFKQLTGATAEESSRFVAALDDFGISADKGASAIFKLGKGADANAKQLSEMGVEIARNADGSVNLTETTLNVADAYTRTQDPAKRAQLVTAAFGKSGSDLIPILEQGRKGLDEFFKGADQNFQLLSDEDLAKAREYELAMDALGDATSGLSREIGSNAAPAVADFANALAEVITQADNMGVLDDLARAIKDAGLTALGPIGAYSSLRDRLDDLTGASDKAAKKTEEAAATQTRMEEATEGATEAVRDGAKAAQEQERALDSLLRAQLGMIDADIRLENSQIAVREAREEHDAAMAKAAAATGKDIALNRENEKATQALKQAIVDEAGALVAKTKVDEESAGRTLSQAQANEIFKARLLEVASTLAPGSPLRAELQGYAGQLQSLPEAKQTLLTAVADTGPAEASFRAMEREFTSRPITVPVSLAVQRAQEDFRQMERDFTNRSGGGGVQRRAAGGPVKAGEPYIVGEEGQELFVPKQSGKILPNDAFKGSGSRVAGGSTVINITMPPGSDGEDVVAAIRRWEKRNGTGWRK